MPMTRIILKHVNILHISKISDSMKSLRLEVRRANAYLKSLTLFFYCLWA